MRVLLVTGSFWPKIGGVETHVAQLAQSLAKAGHQVEIVADRIPAASPYEEIFVGIPVYRVRRYRWRPLKLVSYLLRVGERVRRFRPDVIHCHMVLPAAFAATLTSGGRPTVVTVHGDDVVTVPQLRWGHRRHVAGRLLTDWTLRRMDRVIAPCRWIEGVVASIVLRGRIRVIYNGIAVAPECPDHPGDFVLATRRFDPKNGLRYLIEAARRLPHITFVLAGDGPEWEQLRREAPRNVQFPGSLGAGELSSLYRTCAFTVLPSLVEIMPYSALESMAMGKPVVATAVGGIPELIIHGKNGWLVPPADVDKLAEPIDYLFQRPDLVRVLGEEAYRTIRGHFSWDVILPRILRCYEEVGSTRGWMSCGPDIEG
jgi:glycosyltransferase involved in cell wall biosynthesis